MNAESSDWKRFIPVSDELNAIYEEMDVLSKQQSYEQTDDILSPLPNRHISVFGLQSDESRIPHIEQELR